MSETTPPCTCHPDDNPPVPCARRYALTECQQAARKTTDWLAETVTPADLEETRQKRRRRRWGYVRAPATHQVAAMARALRACGCDACNGLALDIEAFNAD